ncbi:MAG: hypothetical protein M3500_05215 [Actinomycetota bacterium]|nr:hypothetical protein [Actinomycetota bacterium]
MGALAVDACDGPVRLNVTLQRVDQERIEASVRDPSALDGIGDEVAADLEAAIVTLLIRCAVAAIVGAAVLGLLVFRRTRAPFIAAGMSVAILPTTAGIARATWRPEALSSPTYSGLLVNANTLIGSATDLTTKFSD